MHILSLGTNHNTAPVKLREQLSLNEDEVRAALARLAGGHLSASIAELVIISTCNRIELYALSSHLAFAELETFLSDICGLPADAFHTHLYRYKDMEAAQHLFEVASGLDSLVIGEPQILGQIVRALELSRAQNMAGPTLNRLFQAAIHAGKRARTETAISRNPASVSSLAVSLAERAVHPIADAQVVILGAGEMAELAVEALRKRGANRILVVNRTLERARDMAGRWNAQAATFEHLDAALVSTDILISSTGAPYTILTVDMVKQAMQARPHRPLVLIDIAVPRDVDPDAASLPHVKVFDMDSLNAHLEDSLARRMDEIPHVKAILGEELAEFELFLNSLDMLPIIANLRQQAELIRTTELEKSLRHMPDLTEEERERIEALTHSIVKKLLDHPTRRLRAESTNPRAPEYAAVTRTLFNLPDERTHPASTAAD